ncbi:GPI-c transferase complex [Diplogelasinospora grovesii]|uniref:GPI-c transferase complex n=1 Tax=Diplogelasinospora grovesii TaxID=303347 RepID=A0AAN6NHV2_9PEZI|nr:GPI-c transferase complex [Diplogelasinospora grovesii]
MLTTPPTLYTRRPSPTTAEFTLTTCPPLTLPLRVALSLLFLGRLVLVLGVVMVCYARWTISPFYNSSSTTSTTASTTTDTDTSDAVLGLLWLLSKAHHTYLGHLSTRIAAAIPLWLLGLLSAGALYAAVFLRVHTTESLLVLRGLGIQTATNNSLLFGFGSTTRFIPTEKIRDVLINEAFRGFEVRYYLVVVVDGESDVVVVFPRLLPRKDIVESVWRGVRGCLYDSQGRVEHYHHHSPRQQQSDNSGRTVYDKG